jgi:hypothetical protein
MVARHDANNMMERHDGKTCFGIPQKHDGNDMMERHDGMQWWSDMAGRRDVNNMMETTWWTDSMGTT